MAHYIIIKILNDESFSDLHDVYEYAQENTDIFCCIVLPVLNPTRISG
jgi:hypothetical protein